MQTFILKSDNKAAMKVIKAAAKEMKITLTEKKEEETDEFFYINGVRVRKGKGKLNVDKMAGSLSHIKICRNSFRITVYHNGFHACFFYG